MSKVDLGNSRVDECLEATISFFRHMSSKYGVDHVDYIITALMVVSGMVLKETGVPDIPSGIKRMEGAKVKRRAALALVDYVNTLVEDEDDHLIKGLIS